MEVRVWSESEWAPRAAAHAARLEPYLRPHLARREARVKHPVHDFLFTYYDHRPAQLRRWHPGFGSALAGPGAASYVSLKGYGDQPAAVTVDYLQTQVPLVARLQQLLVATAGRPGNFGCFGLHEWAMVYRLDDDQTRHAAWPLRLGGPATDAVVEGQRIQCSHFDAFRFFTEPARPLNTLQPRSDDRPDFEQPSCLHATMDLYKTAYRLTPLIASEVVADAFELAWDTRNLDMRAAPYDLSGLSLDPTGEVWTPVPIETPEGRRDYAEAQRALTERAAPIRQRLIQECERLLAWRSSPATVSR